MNITQLVSAVYTETNRPDLVAETLQAVLESILQIHSSEEYIRDINESQVVFDTAAYIQTLDLRSLPLFRKMKYIRKTIQGLATYEQSPSLLLPGNFLWPPTQFDFLEKIDPEEALDRYSYERQNVWYQAGKQVNLKSSTSLRYALIGWYAYPTIDAANGGAGLSSWIADEFPYAIIYRAAGIVFAKIGEEKSFAIYMTPPDLRSGLGGGLYHQLKRTLDQNNIVA